jgi:3'-5' exoribonuclease
MSDLLSIRELKARAGSDAVPAILRAQLASLQARRTKSDKEFLELALTDGVDAFTLRVWSDHPLFQSAQSLLARAFTEITGDWTQNQYGLEVRNASMRVLADDQISALLAGPSELREKQAADFAFIVATCAGLADPRLRLVSQRFIDLHGDRFRRCAAAREYHHARRGGLVEHVAQMMRSARALAGAYPTLNRDLLVAGVLFHDCGKLWENCYLPDGFVMPYDERGELLGHITIGIELVNRLWRDILETAEAAHWTTLEPATEDVRLHLLHLIASHHGEPQFGSPVYPKTPEAVVLHHVDNIDAKLEMFAEGYLSSLPLAKNILERRRPLPGNLVRPLAQLDPPPPDVLPETISSVDQIAP